MNTQTQSSTTDRPTGSLALDPRSAFAGHTPGPWQIYTGSDADRARKDGFVLVVAGGQSGRIVANVNAESCPDAYSAPAFVRMPVEANARLIAAAPEMLELLKDVSAWLEKHLRKGVIHAGTHNRNGDLVSRLRDVISRATLGAKQSGD